MLIKRKLIAGALACAFLASSASAAVVKEPFGGQPPLGSKASVTNLSEQVAYQRAFEAVVWAMPAAAIYRFRVGALDIPGMADNAVIANPGPLTQTTELITANQTTPYISAVTDLRKGPVVLELPAKTDKASLYGQIVDAWQLTVADVGPSGLDKGAGAKYLLLPPGHSEPVPAGYTPIQFDTYRVSLAFRSVAAAGATNDDAYQYSKTLKMYPYSAAANPPDTKFVNIIDLPMLTLPLYDIRALHDIKAIIDVEPTRPQDKVMMGMLKSIGIERGKPFNPTGKLKAAMERGVKDAYFYIQQQTDKLHNDNLYWPDRHWSLAMFPDEKQSFEYVSDDAVDVDKRAAAWSYFTFYPQKLSAKTGTVYLAPNADKDGKPLAAGATYRLRVPSGVPAKQFWSLTMYDHATRSFINNPLKRNGVDSTGRKPLKMNADGSVDLYFGPKAPAGFESNWLPTMGKRPYLWFRLYSPDTAFWDKSFKLPDVERVK